MDREIVLAGAVRTAIGKYGGSLSELSYGRLGGIVIREAVRRAGISAGVVDEVIMGAVLPYGQGQNVARQAAVEAGLPVKIPAMTLNNVCGSGLKGISIAATMIRSGEADVMVAGGMENMSAAVYALDRARFGYRMGDSGMIDTMIRDGLWDVFNNYHMGITAENVAKEHGISREMQDAFAAESQQKCERAWEQGFFDSEIVSVELKSKKGPVFFRKDEYPRPGVTSESLAALKPAFKKDGTVTAGNASGINDGAAAVVVMSADKARELGVQPMARLTVSASAGVDPSIMGIGPAYSTRKALEKAGLGIEDMDLIEANEAFASQAVAVGRLLGWDASRVNVNGGAIALGHPVGASGARIMVTLLHEMQRRKSRYGLATLCVGGGMGVSSIVERI